MYMPTPETLPKTDEEWTILLKIFAWLSGVGIFSFTAAKIIWSISKWFQGVNQMRTQLCELGTREEKYVELTDFEMYKQNCKEKREAEINQIRHEFEMFNVRIESKLDLLLIDRGLIDGDTYSGDRRRKTDLSNRFHTKNK